MHRLLSALAISIFVGATHGLRCWECSEALNDAHCRQIGRMRECMFNQDACEIEIREHEGWGGHIYLYKHCKQSKACDNNHIQNPRAAFQPSQCNPDDFNSVCRCCCYEDECNVAQDACFARVGCPALPTTVPYGSVSCSNGYARGSICTVTCNANTQITEPASTVCRGDGTWSHDLARCLYQECEPRTILANGWYVCSNAQYAGSQCTAFCRPGYELVGAPVSTCMASTLRWNYFPPRCVGKKCPDRGTIDGGIVTCSDGNNLQSRCKAECLGFRRLEGISDSYCQDDGTWSHDLPVCVEIECEPRGTIINGRVDCSLGNQVESNCLAVCDEGFRLDGVAQSTCLPTGFWSQPLPRCIRISCPPRGKMVGGTVGCTNGNEVGSVCTAECAPGTQLIGASTSQCQADGTWDLPLPTCQRILCPERSILINGRLSIGCEIRTVGQTCTATCDRDKRMVGVKSADCMENGEWSDPLPVCEDIICPPIDFSSQPGDMVCSNDFFYKSRCRFRCDPGYRLDGAPYVDCKRNSRWTTRPPTCRRVVCRNRGRVANGVVTCSNANEVNSQCDVVCNEGYRLRGRESSTCLPNGKWDFRLPKCQPIICPPRGTLRNGVVSCTNGNVFGSVCTAVCNGGRELVGSRLSRCGADGQWDVDLPVCRNLPCPDQGDIELGSKTCTNFDNIGSRCTFECFIEGYELYPPGRTTNICQPNQRWNVPKPCCTRPCPPYAVMDIVLVLDSSSSIGAENWVLLVDFVKGVINSFIVAPDLANFALFRYNRRVDTDTQVLLNDYPGDVSQVIAALDRIPYDGSGTFTGLALDHALQVSLSVANGNRPDVRDLVMVITDGRAADDVKTPADALRAAGVEILVLGIEPPRGSLDMEQLRDIAGSEANLVVASDGFAGLDTQFVATLGSFICGEPCT